MKARKEKQFLVFEFEDGKDVKFDLSSGNFIGKKGKPVKALTGQLAGYSIDEVIDSFEDEKYKMFLRSVEDKTRKKDWRGTGSTYSNVGTFLNHVRDNLYLEQFFACGLTNIDVRCKMEMADVPKSLQKLLRQNPNVKLNNDILHSYCKNPNMWNTLAKEEYEMFDIWKLLNTSYYRNKLDSFMNLINTYNYKFKSLARYIDNIMQFEGENEQDQVIEILHDTIRMLAAISDKYEKYPRYLQTIHNITIRNYNRLKKDFNEEMFERRIKLNMEFKKGDWVIQYPKTTNDIKDEAVQQNSCVASYIDKVIDGECDILFLRKSTAKTTPLVTIEVKNNKVVQARGKFNRECTVEELEFLKAYELYLNSKGCNRGKTA